MYLCTGSIIPDHELSSPGPEYHYYHSRCAGYVLLSLACVCDDDVDVFSLCVQCNDNATELDVQLVCSH